MKNAKHDLFIVSLFLFVHATGYSYHSILFNFHKFTLQLTYYFSAFPQIIIKREFNKCILNVECKLKTMVLVFNLYQVILIVTT